MTEFDLNLLPARLDGIDDTLITLGRDVAAVGALLTNQEAPKPQHDKLFTALAKAQTELENAEQDSENTHFRNKYASLGSVMTAIRGPLSKNSLAILQLPRYETTDKGVLVGLETILGHSSGQSISNYFALYPPKQDPQGIGSALTYLRRYAAMAIVGIAGAADDDAEGTVAEPETITAAEADEILALADELFGSDADALLARMCEKVFFVEGVPKIAAGEAPIALQRIKNTRKRKDEEKEKPPEKSKPKAKPKAKDEGEEAPPVEPSA